MADPVFADTVASVVNGGGITASATTIYVPTADASDFPAIPSGDYIPAIITDSTGETHEEIRITARSGSALTVTRNVGGSNQAWPSGSIVRCTPSAGALTQLFSGSQVVESTNGARFELRIAEKTVTVAAAATTTESDLLPANALVYAVSSYVTAQPPGTTTFQLGVSGATARYGNDVESTTSTANVGAEGPTLYTTATDLVITPNTTPSAATGQIQLAVIYAQLTALSGPVAEG